MSHGVRVIRLMRRDRAIRCWICGREIEATPYVSVNHNHTGPHYYHEGCYPQDSRPRSGLP